MFSDSTTYDGTLTLVDTTLDVVVTTVHSILVIYAITLRIVAKYVLIGSAFLFIAAIFLYFLGRALEFLLGKVEDEEDEPSHVLKYDPDLAEHQAFEDEEDSDGVVDDEVFYEVPQGFVQPETYDIPMFLRGG